MDIFDVLVDLNSHSKQTRTAAYQTLLDSGKEIVPQLVDEFPLTGGGARLSVIRALGEIGDERAVPLLLDAMRERSPDSIFMLPSLAAKALGQIGGEAAVEGLVTHLTDDNHGVRRMAARMLARFRERRAIEGLALALEDADAKVRVIAIESLQKINTPHAVAVLDAAGHWQ